MFRNFRFGKFYRKHFTVPVDNLNAYRKIPKKEREILGFWYKIPQSFLLGGGNFHLYWMEEYPIQHRIREFFVDLDIFLSVKKRIFSEWFTKTFNPKNKWARKTVPKLLAEYDYIMENILFNGLTDYVDSGCIDTTDWDYNEQYSSIYNRIMDVYYFANEELPKRRKEEDELLSEIFSDPKSKGKNFKERWGDTLENGLVPLEKSKQKKLKALQLREEETEDLISKNLKEVIELRGSLW